MFLLALWLHHVLLPSHGSVEKLTVTSCSWGFLVHGLEQFGISIILMCLCSLQFLELGVLLVFSINQVGVFCLFWFGFFFFTLSVLPPRIHVLVHLMVSHISLRLYIFCRLFRSKNLFSLCFLVGESSGEWFGLAPAVTGWEALKCAPCSTRNKQLKCSLPSHS